MNEDVKNRFLESLSNSERPLVVSMFKKLSKYEQLYKKDLSEFSITEIDRMYSSMNTMAAQVYYLLNHRLRRYSVFAGVIDNNYKYFANYASFSAYADDSIATGKRLHKLSNRFANASDKFLLLAPYYGFTSEDDYRDIREFDMHNLIDAHTLIMPDKRKLFIDQGFYEICKNALQTYEYTNNGKVTPLGGNGPIKYALNSNKEEKGITNYSVLITAKYARNIRPVIGNKYSFNYIRTSGIVERTDEIIVKYDLKTYIDIWNNKQFQETIAIPFKLKTIRMFHNKYKPHSLFES